MQFEPFSGDVDYPELEKRILRFWQDHQIDIRLTRELVQEGIANKPPSGMTQRLHWERTL